MATFSAPSSSSHFHHHQETSSSSSTTNTGGSAADQQQATQGSGGSNNNTQQQQQPPENNNNVLSCKQCGSTELDTDHSRGDTVCTQCGYVLEESFIVSEVCFEEDGHGGASAIGQFVSSESKGGGGIGLHSSGGGANGNYGMITKESREITLRAAKKKITEVAQQLRLNQHCIDMSFNFFKMALHKQLTKGRKHLLTVAACIYMTCRIEGTPHLLIDFSDVVQMDIYALGRTFIQLSRALFINIPAVDPCMYILRFAHKFNLGKKTHEVSMTALRLVQRMKRDWMHLGRRPSGLCGAALLIAARLHNFSRTVQDIIHIVKVHETTLRKRLIEFGETPSSSLTIEEFMSVDLEEEHDPPSFKLARIRDREQLQKLLLDEDLNVEMTALQSKIEDELQKRRSNRGVSYKSNVTSSVIEEAIPGTLLSGSRSSAESTAATKFVIESTVSTISSIISSSEIEPPTSVAEIKQEKLQAQNQDPDRKNTDVDRMLMPPPPKTVIPVHLRRPSAQEEEEYINHHSQDEENEEDEDDPTGGELDLTGIDDTEIDSYLMTDVEIERKRIIWEKLNEDYLIAQEEKKKQLEQDILDGKFDEKKKKRGRDRANNSATLFQAKSANEAIKIMLTERKLSSKINYDVLKKLSSIEDEAEEQDIKKLEPGTEEMVTVIESGPIIPWNKRKTANVKSEDEEVSKKKRKIKKETKTSTAAEEEHEETGTETNQQEEEEPIPEEIVIEEGPHVVIETGPVQYKPIVEEEEAAEEVEEETYNEDEEYYDEEGAEEDAEQTLSARELLTKFRGEEHEDYDEDYYD